MIKRIAFTLLLLGSGVFVGCDKDKDDDPQNQIQGAFSLLSFQCCLFTAEEFAAQQMVYEFDGEGTVIVTIDVELEEFSQVPIKESGTYSYTESGDRINLQGVDYDFTLIGDQLTLLDMPEVDGSIIVFERNTENNE